MQLLVKYNVKVKYVFVATLSTTLLPESYQYVIFFRFWFWLYRHHRHVVLRRHAKFHPNRTVIDRVMMSYRFSRWRPHRRNFTSGFGLGDVAVFRRSKSINQISSRQLNPWRRYNNFRFGKQTSVMLELFFSGIDFNTTTVIGISFRNRVPN